MTFKQLQYFVSVVQEGSISAAAKKLYMSQPPLSAQIRLLEEEFGCTLLERGQRKIHLTAAGRLLYEHALTILELNRITHREMRDVSQKERETIRVGIVSSLAGTKAARWIASFSENRPQARFEISEADTYSLLKKLEAGTIHLAIVRTPFLEEGFLCRSLSSDYLSAAGLSSFFTGCHSPISLGELSRKPLLVYRRWLSFLNELFSKKGLSPDYFCISEDARTCLSLARQGLGVALVPQSALLSDTDPDMVSFLMEGCSFLSEMKLVRRPHAYLPEGAEAFWDFLYASAAGS